MTEQAQVTQADRDAARAAQADMIVGGFQGDKEVWRKVEQAFARHRIAAIEEMREALEPFARLQVPTKSIFNAGAYSLRFADIERAARALTNLGGQP